jgi:molybdopterin-containing oxidoreductase family iron-sulfur binding subunit
MIELDVLRPDEVAADRAAGRSPRRPAFWRSAEDRADAPGYAALRASEFLPGALPAAPDGAPDGASEGGDGPSRRTFLKVMGASAALAGLTGCRRPAEEILPYARMPEDVVHAIANYYATAFPHGGVVHALLVESHEGRPTKVEGNPDHPVSRGKTDVFAQASLLNLYDPDRSRLVRRGEAPSSWAAFAAEMQRLRPGSGVAVLAEPSSSLTQARLRQQLAQRFPGARWIELGPHGDDPAALGAQAAFGRPARPLYRFSEADVIVAFDADFVGPEDPNSVWNNREYAASRRVEARAAAGRPAMSRLYAVESQYSITGGMADHRRRLRAADIPHLAAAVGQALGVGAGSPGAASFATDPFVQALVEDVRAAAGRAVFVAGPTQPAQVHALAAALNGRYGASAVAYLDPGTEPVQPLAETLPALVRDMAAGRVQLLLMLGTNPVYSLPAELGFAAALARVPLSVHVGLHRDESAVRATWHVPAAHYLEHWGDGRAWDGTVSIIQPLIAPLYDDAHSEIEVLDLLATGQVRGGYELVRETLAARLGSEDAWRTALHDGFLPGTAYPAVGAGGTVPDLSQLPVLAADALELTFRVSPKVYDGRFANNAWMQELPHNVTKLTWDNAAVMSPATAEALGVAMRLEDGKRWTDRVTLRAGDVAVSLPVWEQPGHPDGSIQLELGYGRALHTDRPLRDRGLLARVFDRDLDVYLRGPVAGYAGGDDAEPVGVNVSPLQRLGYPAVLPGGFAVEAEGTDYLLATTQDHGTTASRDVVRMTTVGEYQAHAGDAFHEHFLDETPWEAYPPLWTDDRAPMLDPRIRDAMYAENQWGMTVDLNACTGCNACVVACQSENNVPVVGKDQVSRGREMHWLRIDRYYTSTAPEPPLGQAVDQRFEDPEMVMQPMFCVHCEYAPCESVCPVYATSHSPDGLNEMTYNRCIGTRYCSNNCPYKVRRFNFYNWTKHTPDTLRMGMNPNVTVRFRGVMEKCTYCVQRIRRVQMYAHIQDRPVRDGEVLTACQQACPADALVFGDIADPASRVSRMKASPRAYEVLAELNVKPRTSHLARLRNPNPRLAARVETHEDRPATPADQPAEAS